MTAWLEPLSAVMRIGGDNAKHGDSYHFAATIRYLGIDVVEVLGVDTPVTKTDWKAIEECLRKSGVKRMLFKRIKNGIEREHWRDL